MRYVDTGNGKMPLISLIAILSISLTVNLPGLAITPIMDKLDQVFHHVTELETQLLTVLPNLVTIPFILCAGKICTQKNQIFVLGLGLIIYILTGILYFFADNMTELILLSCMLGVGCGLVIPLAASLISQYFAGSQRTRQLGMKSSLSNFSVIFATLFVGWMASISWHMAFIVYLVPLIPFCLLPFMTDKYIARHRTVDAAPNAAPAPAQATPKPAPEKVVSAGRRKATMILLFGAMAIYFLATYGTEVISYYLPYTMNHYKLSTGDVGVATSMYFAGATISGYLLPKIIKLFGRYTMHIAIATCVCGLFMVGFIHMYWSYIVGVLVIGLGYGVIQPAIYDKTSQLAPSPAKSTAYFSYLLTCNYVAISVVPFIISGTKRIFDAQGDWSFSFVFNGFVLVAMLLVAIWKRNNFVVNVNAPKSEIEKK